MAHLGPEAVQAILDGATMGTSQRAERENPAIIEGEPTVGKGNVGCHWVSPSRNACDQLEQQLRKRILG